MGLFKSDLYRNFAIGFSVGAALVGWNATGGWDGDIASPAQAAEMPVFITVEPTSEFLIAAE